MSGQPYKKFTDVNKFRNEYLDTLNIRASLDDMNLQANKNYKATGSLPAVSQMKDSRTTSEILADTEKLKIDIMTALTKISNPQFAAAVVQRIMSSPINQDNSLLIFTAQRVNDLVEKLGKIYAYGIKGDTNDVQQIVNFLVSMYNDKNILASTTQDFLNRYNGPNYGSFGRSSSDALQNSKNILIKAKGTINSLYNLINHLHDEGDKGNIQTTPQGLKILEAHMNKMFSIDILMNILIRLIPEQNFVEFMDKSVSGIIDNGIDPSQQTMAKILAYKDFLSFGIPSSANISLTEKKLITIVQTLQDIINKKIYSGLFPLMTNITNALDNFESILTPSENWDANNLNMLNTAVINLMKELEQANNYEEAEDISREGQITRTIPRSLAKDPDEYMAFQIRHRLGQLISSILKPPQILPNGEQRSKLISDLVDNLTEDELNTIITAINDSEIDDEESLIKYLSKPENEELLIHYYVEDPLDTMMKQYDRFKIIEPAVNTIKKQYDRFKIIEPAETALETALNLYGGFGEPNKKIGPDDYLDWFRNDLTKKIITERWPGYTDTEYGNLDLTKNFIYDPAKKFVTERWPGYTDTDIEQRNTGNGIKQRRKRGRPKGSGLQRKYSEVVKSSTATDKGIDEDRRFIKFGKYLINNKKLNDGILAVKRPSGNNIIEFPTQHITSNFKNVIKTMIGGGMPKYEELDRLSEPEKTYLHKLASKANIIDKFSIPAPTKSNHEKDIHDFEVMKGEIMSGNDNNDLIKKFKIHILKLSKTGALPKREVMELLETLLELGY